MRIARVLVAVACLTFSAAGCATHTPPASGLDVTGTWSGAGRSRGAAGFSRDVVLILQQNGARVSGQLSVPPSTDNLPVQGELNGDTLHFQTASGGGAGYLTLAGDELNGEISGVDSYRLTYRVQLRRIK